MLDVRPAYIPINYDHQNTKILISNFFFFFSSSPLHRRPSSICRRKPFIFHEMKIGFLLIVVRKNNNKKGMIADNKKMTQSANLRSG